MVLSGFGMAMDDLSFTPALRAVLGARLARFERRRLPLEGRRKAVVTLTLVPDDHGGGAGVPPANGGGAGVPPANGGGAGVPPANGCGAGVPPARGQASILLTRRARGLRRHSGQFALPGGRVDPGETAAEAGLRELEEEVGLRLPPDRILGWLDDFATHSGFVIAPVVLWAGERDALKPDPQEVAVIYRVPLADCGRSGALKRIPFSGLPRVPALSLKSVGTWVFPPTAAIIHQFAELAVHGRHTEVVDFKQPAFARR